MSITARQIVTAVVFLAACLSTGTASATLSRAWVSGKGTDQASCGPIATPCRSLQYVHDNIISPAGEIDVLDPAGYGSLTITKSLSVINDGGGTAGVLAPSGGNGITINAGSSDRITLRGLTIEGSGNAANGVLFNSGASLTIAHCVAQNFTGVGILLVPASGSLTYTIANTIVSDNAFIGIYLHLPNAGTANSRGVIDRVLAVSNGYGIAADLRPATSGTHNMTISNGVASNNTNDGLYFATNATVPAAASVDAMEITNNIRYGVWANTGNVSIFLGRSVIGGNGTAGVQNQSSPNSFFTYKDNRFDANATDIAGTAPIAATPK